MEQAAFVHTHGGELLADHHAVVSAVKTTVLQSQNTGLGVANHRITSCKPHDCNRPGRYIFSRSEGT